MTKLVNFSYPELKMPQPLINDDPPDENWELCNIDEHEKFEKFAENAVMDYYLQGNTLDAVNDPMYNSYESCKKYFRL